MIPRNEYPRPQFERKGWLCLNGAWQFEVDQGVSGRARGLVEKAQLDGEITVPFCPESRLSGVNCRDFMRAVWYKRGFKLPAKAVGKRVFVNFGAVDYEAEVWINGISIGTHRGGYTGFSLEATAAVKYDEENIITVCAYDDNRSGLQPCGKQSERYESYGCSYTRTTGIWQTVWLEWTNETYIKKIKLTPDAANGSLLVEAYVDGDASGCTLEAEASFEGEYETGCECDVDGNAARMLLLLEEPRLWNVGEPNLYDLRLKLKRDDKTLDTVDSYFGLRTVELKYGKCLINGKPVFQRLILDQGFYPEGIYTAPTDEELKNDILRSQAMGFNGARLHQKVFEQRFLYWADHLGYICWGEYASWGIEPGKVTTLPIFLNEWIEAVERDFNSPAIIGWCPWNETWSAENGTKRTTIETIWRMTRALDATRPCIDTSGGYHYATDIYDSHDYEQDVDTYKERYKAGAEFWEHFPGKEQYDGRKPRFVSEYGGIGWSVEGGWSYGRGPKTEAEFIARYKGLTDALLDDPGLMGFCYTQLTDVEQERNGLYYYDRRPKFDPAVISAITSRRAAIEE